MRRFADSVSAHSRKLKSEVMLLLMENTTGTENSMGGSFEDIAEILYSSDYDRLGLCLDTRHTFQCRI